LALHAHPGRAVHVAITTVTAVATAAGLQVAASLLLVERVLGAVAVIIIIVVVVVVIIVIIFSTVQRTSFIAWLANR
jgi:hypothetical protein